jgi:phosphoribosylamine-glycine ligase
MIKRIFGDAGIQVIIEEFLQGFEASIIGVSNGEKIFPFIPAKDYKSRKRRQRPKHRRNGFCSAKSGIHG